MPLPFPIANAPASPQRIARGGYLFNSVARCAYVRTLKPQPDAVPERSFHFPTQLVVRTLPQPPLVRAPNITPDADTGIGTWSDQQLVTRFEIWERAPARPLPAAQRRNHTVMPWKQLGGMTRRRLRAIYTFLRTQKPIIHRVVKRDPVATATRQAGRRAGRQ